MPNHVHVLMTPLEGFSVGKVMGPLKGFCAHEIHETLNEGSGRLWQPESYERLIRDLQHFERVARYIEWNPVKAKLCGRPEDWPYSTANLKVRERLDTLGL
jgi:REP element-mobilizing transposase RayT